MNSTVVRAAVAAGILWFVFFSGGSLPVVPSVTPYTGPLTAAHSAAQSMQGSDRAALSEALTAGGEMLRADSRGLVGTTEAAQRYVAGILEFSYNGLGKPTQKYPSVADAISAEAKRIVGDTVGPFDAAGRSRLADALTELGKAIK
jgi:hypothetical protein